MSTIYIILAVVVASIIAFSVFVVIGAIEKKKHININWVLLMVCIILASILTMTLIYHHQNDLTSANIQEAYDNGYEAGKAEATISSIEAVENWMTNTEEVVVNTHEDGSDPVIHIVDGDGEEWVLIADEVVNHN